MIFDDEVLCRRIPQRGKRNCYEFTVRDDGHNASAT